MSFWRITGLVALGMVGFCIWYVVSGLPKTYSWHQKLTIEVETPEGLRTGASVVAVSSTLREGIWRGPSASAVNSKVQGEAAFVELGEGATGGRYLFALLGEAETFAARSLLPPEQRGIKIAGPLLDPAFGWSGLGGEVREKHYPLLVTFTDINDPRSVKKVEPGDLSSHFGPGVKLKRITLEITDEPVTEGRVEKVLGWSRKLQGSIGKDMDVPYSHILNQVTDGSFYAGGH